MLALIIAALLVPVAKLFMVRFAAGAILLPTAAWHKRCSAAGASFLIRANHVFLAKQLCPNGAIQFRADRQNAFQKVIAIDSSIVNARIPGIDDNAAAMKNTCTVDIVAAFFVRQCSDLRDQLLLHIFFSSSVGVLSNAFQPRVRSHSGKKRATLRSDHASRRHDAGRLIYINVQVSFPYTENLDGIHAKKGRKQ